MPSPRRGRGPHATISADPYAWPFDGDLTPANTASSSSTADRFSAARRLRRQDGLRPSPHARARSRRSTACSRHARQGLSHPPHPRGHRPDLSDLPATSAGARQIAPASVIQARAQDLVRGEVRLGDHPELAPRRARPSSTSPARARSAPPTWSCLLRVKGIRNIVLTGITPMCASTPPCARQRPRLRVRCW